MTLKNDRWYQKVISQKYWLQLKVSAPSLFYFTRLFNRIYVEICVYLFVFLSIPIRDCEGWGHITIFITFGPLSCVIVKNWPTTLMWVTRLFLRKKIWIRAVTNRQAFSIPLISEKCYFRVNINFVWKINNQIFLDSGIKLY